MIRRAARWCWSDKGAVGVPSMVTGFVFGWMGGDLGYRWWQLAILWLLVIVPMQVGFLRMLRYRRQLEQLLEGNEAIARAARALRDTLNTGKIL